MQRREKQEEPISRVNPEMIRLAREVRGLTQAELADRLNISQGKVSKVLDGIQQLPESSLGVLESALGFPLGFYARDWEVEGPPPQLFRKMSSTLKTPLKKAVARMGLIKNQIRELVKNVDRMPPSVPDFDVTRSEEGPHAIAKKTRIALRVPTGPVASVMRIIERMGCVLVPFDFETRKIDACCDWVDDLPVVFYNINAAKSRLRFSLTHELAHLVMHQTIAFVTDENELEANQFAGEFLMPEVEIKSSLVGLTMTKLSQLKMHWRVSMQAIVMRAKELGVISSYAISNLWKNINIRGYKHSEPLEEYIPDEKPQLLYQLVSVYTDQLEYSYEELANKVSLSVSEFIENFTRQNNLRIVRIS